MLRFLKVKGDSMSPDYGEGDFVVILTIPFLFRLMRPGSTIAFEHSHYGLLIKRIRTIDTDTKEVIVEGANANSLDSRRLGPIRPAAIRGRVIAHIPRP
jgi:hypothetical protein